MSNVVAGIDKREVIDVPEFDGNSHGLNHTVTVSIDGQTVVIPPPVELYKKGNP